MVSCHQLSRTNINIILKIIIIISKQYYYTYLF